MVLSYASKSLESFLCKEPASDCAPAFPMATASGIPVRFSARQPSQWPITPPYNRDYILIAPKPRSVNSTKVLINRYYPIFYC